MEKRIKNFYPFYKGDIAAASINGIDPRILKRSLLYRYLTTEKDSDKKNSDEWKAELYSNWKENHSIAGAITFLHFTQEILDYWPDVNPRMLLVFELAAEAIFFHDLTHEKNNQKNNEQSLCSKIRYKEQPLACILILADELQAWDRPRISYQPKGFSDEVIMKFESKDNVLYELDKTKKSFTLKIEKQEITNGKSVFQTIDELAPINELKKFIQISCL